METAEPLSDRAGARATEGQHGAVGDVARPQLRIDRVPTIVGVVAVVAVTITGSAASVPIAAMAGVGLMVPAAIIDIRTRRLPDRWVGVAAAGCFGAWAAGGLFAGGVDPDLGEVLLGVAVTAGPLLVLHLVSPAAMGFGDVKAAAVLGAALGMVEWQLGLPVLAIASATAATAALVRRRTTVAFGPYLVASAWLVLLAAGTEVIGR